MGLNMDAAFRVSAGVTGQADIDKLARSVDSLDQRFKNVTDTAKGLGAAFVLSKIEEFGASTIELGDQLERLKEKTGIPVAAFAEFKQSAESSQVSLDDLAASLIKLSVSAVASENPTSKQAAAFRALDVSATDSYGHIKPLDQLMLEIADKFHDSQDGATKAAVAVSLFGKSGADLIPFLDKGSASIKAFSLNISDEFAERASKFSESITMLKNQTTSLTAEALTPLLPALTDVTSAFGDLVTHKSDAQGFFSDIGDAARLLGIAVGAVYTTVMTLSDGVVTAFKIAGDAATAQFSKIKTDLDESGKRLDERLQAFNDFQKKLASHTSLLGGTNDDNSKDAPAGDKPKSRINYSGNDEKDAKDLETLQKYIETQKQANLTLQQQGDYVGLTTVQVTQLKAARELDAQVAEKTVGMSPEVVAQLMEQTDAIKAQRLAIIQLNYDQSRTWDTGTQEALTAYVENIGDAASRAKSFWADTFKNMEDVLVNFVTTGKLNFSDFTNSIIKDLIRIEIQQSITGPAAALLKGFTPFGAGAGAGDTVSAAPIVPVSVTDVAPFAMGGIMSSYGELPLNKYAGGGIANSPQLAVFGEGRLNEAYVPLPDGRNIPVSLSGGGHNAPPINLSVTVNNGDGSVSTEEDGSALGAKLAAVTKAVIMNEMRPGGMLAQKAA